MSGWKVANGLRSRDFQRIQDLDIGEAGEVTVRGGDPRTVFHRQGGDDATNEES